MTHSKIDRGHYVEQALPADATILEKGSILSSCISPEEHMHYILKQGSKLELTLVCLPGSRANAEITVDIIEPDAQAHIGGIYICAGEASLDLKVTVRHRAERSISRQYFSGIVASDARSSFEGRIVVAPDAQMTKAFQENHNIVMGDSATAHTSPQLEIYADDVECSHGATVGKLDENEQFYMRSRGIPESEAKVLQMISFLSPALSHLEEGRRMELISEIERTIRSL